MIRHIRAAAMAILAGLALIGSCNAGAHDATGHGPALYIISPADEAVVTSPVTIRFGLRGMGVAPAGVAKSGTGHHHLIIDADLPDLNEPIPKDDHYRHFGGGQTEATLELAPGKHTLQLILGDHNHIPHTPPLISQPITVSVK
ncbi:MAG: DUF4399 domain-containing protein [Sphingomonadales bacterium]